MCWITIKTGIATTAPLVSVFYSCWGYLGRPCTPILLDPDLNLKSIPPAVPLRHHQIQRASRGGETAGRTAQVIAVYLLMTLTLTLLLSICRFSDLNRHFDICDVVMCNYFAVPVTGQGQWRNLPQQKEVLFIWHPVGLSWSFYSSYQTKMLPFKYLHCIGNSTRLRFRRSAEMYWTVLGGPRWLFVPGSLEIQDITALLVHSEQKHRLWNHWFINMHQSWL